MEQEVNGSGHSLQSKFLTLEDDTEESSDEDPILCSQVDRRWLSGWQSWRNNIAWRYTWLTMKIAEIERELEKLPENEPEEQRNDADTLYLPAYPTIASHPFLSLQVPRKRALQTATILQPYKRVRSQSRHKDRRDRPVKQKPFEPSIEKPITKKQPLTKSHSDPIVEPISDTRRPTRRFASSRSRIGDFHDDHLTFVLSNFWEMPGSHSDGRTLTFENPNIEIPSVRVIESSNTHELEGIQQQQQQPEPNKPTSTYENEIQVDISKLEGVQLVKDNDMMMTDDPSEEEEPTDLAFTLRHYRLECLERFKNCPALTIFPTPDGKSGIPQEKEFLQSHWCPTYHSTPPNQRIPQGSWPVSEIRHYEVHVPPIPNQDDLLFVNEDDDDFSAFGTRRKKEKHVPHESKKQTNNKKKKRQQRPSIIDHWEWEIIPEPSSYSSSSSSTTSESLSMGSASLYSEGLPPPQKKRNVIYVQRKLPVLTQDPITIEDEEITHV